MKGDKPADHEHQLDGRNDKEEEAPAPLPAPASIQPTDAANQPAIGTSTIDGNRGPTGCNGSDSNPPPPIEHQQMETELEQLPEAQRTETEPDQLKTEQQSDPDQRYPPGKDQPKAVPEQQALAEAGSQQPAPVTEQPAPGAMESDRQQGEPGPGYQQPDSAPPQKPPPQHQQQEQQEHEQQPQSQQQQRQQQQQRRQPRKRVAPIKLSETFSSRQPSQPQPPHLQRQQPHVDGDATATAAGGSSKAAGLPRVTSAATGSDTGGINGGLSTGEGRPAKRSRVQQASEERLEEQVVLAVGLDPRGLSEEEEALLSDVEAQRPGHPPLGRNQYLRVRNLILTMWRANARRHLTMEEACKAVHAQYTRHAEVAWSYLHSYGLINFGLAVAVVPDMEHEETIIVIGAGLAGLAAAQQLRQLGYRVLVLEARDRPGGRVHTARMEAGDVVGFAELGGSIITGCDGNPLMVLALQGGVPLHAIEDTTPLYWEDGEPVNENLDKQVFGLYNMVLDQCDVLCQRLTPGSADLISVEAALNAIWTERLEDIRSRVRCADGPGAAGPGAANGDETAAYGAADAEELAKLSDQLFNWHIANLEFANAAPASQLSLRHWSQDDAYELMGAHTFTAGGNGRLVQLLAQNLPIMYKCPVAEVRHSTGSNGGVTVVTETGAVLEAAAAVVTLPLGVLKAEAVRFNPPLPAAKQEAIKRLGYGRLNKVALLFPYAFWDTSIDTFACVMRDTKRRGAYYLFYCGAHTGGAPVLTALVAGDAAIAIESLSDAEAVAQVMKVLRNVFERTRGGESDGGGAAPETVAQEAAGGGRHGKQGAAGANGTVAEGAGAAGSGARKLVVPEPLQSLVTRWGRDPYSLGSYSSMAVSCRGAAEYQSMAAPVGGRLFFAGEATIHRYPATMHGAFLSGLREAGRIHYAFARARHGLPPRADGFTGAAEGGEVAVMAAAADGGGGGLPFTATPPSGPALRHVRRMAELGSNLRVMFSAGEADLEFGCFKALFGPQVPQGRTQWALVQIDLGVLKSRTVAAADDTDADDADANGRGAAGGAGAAGGGRAGRRRGAGTGAAGGGSAAAAAVSSASRPGGHHRRALVHLPLPRAAVESLWCMRGGDDARLLALTGRLGVKLPGIGSEVSQDWDPCQQMEVLYEEISQQRELLLLPPTLVAAAVQDDAEPAAAAAPNTAA